MNNMRAAADTMAATKPHSYATGPPGYLSVGRRLSANQAITTRICPDQINCGLHRISRHVPRYYGMPARHFVYVRQSHRCLLCLQHSYTSMLPVPEGGLPTQAVSLNHDRHLLIGA